jgi:hypothetical protein
MITYHFYLFVIKMRLFFAGVQRMQSFVPGTGAQHPVQVKGSRLAQ